MVRCPHWPRGIVALEIIGNFTRQITQFRAHWRDIEFTKWVREAVHEYCCIGAYIVTVKRVDMLLRTHQQSLWLNH